MITGGILTGLFLVGMYFFWKYKTKGTKTTPSTGSGTNVGGEDAFPEDETVDTAPRN